MTLTIEIPDEAAARVRLAAEARGQDMGAFAVAAMLETANADRADTTDSVIPQSKPLPVEEFFAAMTRGVDPARPPLTDYEVSRESMYGDRA